MSGNNSSRENESQAGLRRGNIILLETLKISFDSSLIKVATALRND